MDVSDGLRVANRDEEQGARSAAQYRRHAAFLAQVDPRIVGMTVLFGVLENRPNWTAPLLAGNWAQAFLAAVASVLTGLLILVLAAAALRARRLPRPLALALAVVSGCAIARAVTLPMFLGSSFGEGFPGGEPTAWTMYWFFGRHSVSMWGLLAAAWYFHQRWAERRARLHASELARHRLDAQVAEARLQALQAQVEPHFLFNTLAHVRHLYTADPALARRMIEGFCNYLRTALPQMRDQYATLGTEIALVAAYLDVQKIRMGDRLAVEIAVSDADRGRAFPTMMLATLVENAIKHGLNPLPEGGAVRVSAESSAQTLRIVVADSGQGFSTSRGTGVGLANIRGRLAALYGGAARVTLAPNVPRGIRATIEIPAAPSATHASVPTL